MSTVKEMTETEFREIVIGEYGPNIEKTLKQAEDNNDGINAMAIINRWSA